VLVLLAAGVLGLPTHTAAAPAVSSLGPTGVPPLPAHTYAVRLIGNPAAADPCALINPSWLRQFGTPRPIIPSKPHNCRIQISTDTGAKLYLEVGYYTPLPNATIPGERQSLGGLTIIRDTPPPDRNTCQNVILLSDATRVFIDSYPAPERTLCQRIIEVATTTAANALAHHGVQYSTKRTANWPITRLDACALVTPTELTTLGGVNPAAQHGGYANWWCAWTGPPAALVTIEFLLDTSPYTLTYGSPTTLTGHPAWLHALRGSCAVTVLTHPANTPTDANNLIQITAHAPLSNKQLCDHAKALATAAITRIR
jgi:eukaryotic-like serine/threonine-protein kinase